MSRLIAGTTRARQTVAVQQVKRAVAELWLRRTIKQAAAMLVKRASEEEETGKKKPVSEANKIVNMKTTGGALADYLAPSSWGGERAGRSQAIADAIGEKTTFGVRHPMLQTLGYGATGVGLGGLGGALTGHLMSEATPGLYDSGAPIRGGLLGSGLGALAGVLMAGYNRRNEMRRLNHFYDKDLAAGKVNPKNPKLSILSALLLPSRGPHRTGQVEAVRAMQGERSIADQHTGLRDLLYAARPWVPPIAAIHPYAQNLKTQLRSEIGPEEGGREYSRRPKS